MSNQHIGSDFDDFLKKEGIREEVTAAAIKRVIAWQLAEAMKRMHIKGAALKISGRKRYLFRSTTTKCPGNRSPCFSISASKRGHFSRLSWTSMRIRIIPQAGFFRR